MSARPQPAAGSPPGSLEGALAHVLQVGTYLSIGLVGLGAVLMLGEGVSPTAGGPPLSPAGLVADLAALRPAGFLWLGILGVLSTPALRVLRALIGFWRRGERTMAIVSLAILIVVAVGVFFGLLTG